MGTELSVLAGPRRESAQDRESGRRAGARPTPRRRRAVLVLCFSWMRCHSSSEDPDLGPWPEGRGGFAVGVGAAHVLTFPGDSSGYRTPIILTPPTLFTDILALPQRYSEPACSNFRTIIIEPSFDKQSYAIGFANSYQNFKKYFFFLQCWV